MDTAYESDGEGEEEARLYIDSTQPVSLEAVGTFLETLGHAAQQVLGDADFVIELAEYRQGSLDFLFRKRRRREDERRAQEAERAAREKRLLELAEASERRGKRTEFYAVIAMAVATPPCAAAALDLFEEGEASTVTIQQDKCPPTEFTLSDLQAATRNADRSTPRLPPTRYEKLDMLRDYEDGQMLDLAGRIMPRKRDFFRTAKSTQLPILERTEGLEPGLLVRVRAEVRKTGPEVGIVIFDYELLDDP